MWKNVVDAKLAVDHDTKSIQIQQIRSNSTSYYRFLFLLSRIPTWASTQKFDTLLPSYLNAYRNPIDATRHQIRGG